MNNKLIVELRSMTGVGFMDCKKALIESGNDLDKAVIFLREKGLATQIKKSDRETNEGVVTSLVTYSPHLDAHIGIILEVNCETDFVAKNNEFKAFISSLIHVILQDSINSVDELLPCCIINPNSDLTVNEELQNLIIKFGENIKIRRLKRIIGENIFNYNHDDRIGVLLNLESKIRYNDELRMLGKDICLQIASMNPTYLDNQSIPLDIIQEEKNILIDQMMNDPKMMSKPENIRMKIADGRLHKFYSENCLMEQKFIKDDSVTVATHINSAIKLIGKHIEVAEFIRYERGK